MREDDRDAVRGAGLAHVLAVSGLHVSLIAGLMVVAIRRALPFVSFVATRWDPARVAAAVGVPLALSYAAFAGGAPSAWRAAVTAAIAWGLVALGRRPSAVAVALTAGLVLGALAPGEAARPSFVLSILATTAVVTTVMPNERGPRAWLAAGLAVSARTTVATAPVVLWCFGTVPLIGVLANVVLVPIGTLLLVPLAVLHALVAACAPPLAVLTGGSFEAASAAFVAACDALASLLPALALPPPTVPQGIAIGVACAAVLVARSWRARALVIAGACITLAATEVAARPAADAPLVLRATFLDVGQGDAALLDMPDGRLVLVDAGGTRSSFDDPGRRVLVPLLAARRRERVDVAVLSHPHPDHYGGLAALLEAVPVGEVWDTRQAEAEQPDGPVARLFADARRRGARVLGPQELCGRPRRFGVASVRVIAPCPHYDPGRDPNDNSFVLRVAMGRRAILFTGDAEAYQEAHVAALAGELRTDVLQVGHHGSRTSSTEAFLAAVRPELAVISAGRGNRYGHPHPEVLRRLKEAETRVVRLDRAGGTVVETDGESLVVETWHGTRFAIPSPP